MKKYQKSLLVLNSYLFSEALLACSAKGAAPAAKPSATKKSNAHSTRRGRR